MCRSTGRVVHHLQLSGQTDNCLRFAASKCSGARQAGLDAGPRTHPTPRQQARSSSLRREWSLDHGAASDPKHSLTLRTSTCVPFRGRDRADFPYAVSDRADLFSSSRSRWITNTKTVFLCHHGRLFWGAYSTKNNHERGAGACLQSLLPPSQGN